MSERDWRPIIPTDYHPRIVSHGLNMLDEFSGVRRSQDYKHTL